MASFGYLSFRHKQTHIEYWFCVNICINLILLFGLYSSSDLKYQFHHPVTEQDGIIRFSYYFSFVSHIVEHLKGSVFGLLVGSCPEKGLEHLFFDEFEELRS